VFSLSLGEAKFSSLSGNCRRAFKFERGFALPAKTPPFSRQNLCRLKALAPLAETIARACSTEQKDGLNLANLSKKLAPSNLKRLNLGAKTYLHIQNFRAPLRRR